MFSCDKCLNNFTTIKIPDKHKEYCYSHGERRLEFPLEGKEVLRFKNHHKKIKVPVPMIADF